MWKKGLACLLVGVVWLALPLSFYAFVPESAQKVVNITIVVAMIILFMGFLVWAFIELWR